jgi:beta-lactamase class D
VKEHQRRDAKTQRRKGFYCLLNKTRPFVLFALALLCACGRGPDPEPEFEAHFQERGLEGAFILYDLNADSYVRYDAERCARRFIPASTFKPLNALIALEVGSVLDENEIIPWDGVDRGYAPWNRDHDLGTAMQASAVWFYQELARRTGPERMQRHVDAVGYGNQDISGQIDSFWLEGGLRISPEEQIAFLRRLYEGSLPFSDRSMAVVRQIILLEKTAGYKLSGKTGWAGQVEPQIGWFVGYLETGGNVYFFATNVEKEGSTESLGQISQQITREILKEMGLLPE